MNVSPKAIEVIKLVKNAVNNSITGVSFFSIKEYKSSESGEISNRVINIGVDYNRAKQKDLVFLENMKLSDHEFKSAKADLELAKAELIISILKPNENKSNGQIDAFTRICEGVKVKNETGQIFVYGYSVSKTVLVKGEYKTVKSSPKTIAKNEIKALLKHTKYRHFALEMGNTLKANGNVIEL